MKTSIFVLEITIITATISHADTQIGADADHVTINVNTDNGNVGDFIIYNGINSNKITTFQSSKNYTKMITSNNNTFLLNDQGAFLSNLTLGGIAKGSISSSSTSAINGSQLFKEISERQNNDIQLQNNIHNEANARIDGDQKTLNSANLYSKQLINTEANLRQDNDIQLQNNIHNEADARIDGDQKTLNSANLYSKQLINTEANLRQNNDIQLQNNIHNEADARIDGDQKTLNSANLYSKQLINTEANLRQNNDIQLQNNIHNEANARIDGDQKTLNSANLYSKQLINTEANLRQDNDIQLQNNIHNEANARIDGDQKTLDKANAYTDQKINKLETHYQAAVAASIAIASLPQPSQAGKNMVSFGAANVEREQGYAIGLSGVSLNNKWIYKVATAGNSRGRLSTGIALGFQW